MFKEWTLTDHDMYRKILRIYPEVFGFFLRAVDPIIGKQYTNFRDAVTKRLAITFLATGVCNQKKVNL